MQPSSTSHFRSALRIVFGLGASACLSACFTNSGSPNLAALKSDASAKDTGTTAASGTSTSGSTSSASAQFKISNIVIAGGASGSSSTAATTNIFLDVSKTVPSTAQISQYCSVSASSTAQSSKPCVCKFSWSEVNPHSGSNLTIPRVVQTAVTNVLPHLVSCSAPNVYSKEIPDGTMIKITVQGASANTSSGQFSVANYNYTKSTTVQQGSFQDAQGRAFDNIYRYSCYEKFSRGMEIKTKREKLKSNTQTGENMEFNMATKFCVAKGGGSPPAGCENLSSAQNSAQSYYYNLFIRNTDRGNINSENKGYKCPKVKETILPSGTVGGQNDYWPLDATFALSLSPNEDFPVGVEAFSKLGLSGDPTTKGEGCFGGDTGGGGDSGLVKSCLGFAKKPNPDGSCPYIRDASNQIRMTYRLRRYIALYPPKFDSDGKLKDEPQATDTIYVLDRPVYNSTGNPLKPPTMRGPKPCPFAYFDHRAVTSGSDPSYLEDLTQSPPWYGGVPQYRATNFAQWNGLNVDGIRFPNVDTPNSCSAAIPVLSTDKSIMSLMTIGKHNPELKELWVRPVKPWAPHYEEDTEFQACAPQASPLVDPPLHFTRNTTTGQVSWCAEAYPTQNPNYAELDKKGGTGASTGNYPALVRPFTSHVVKNSASPACYYSAISLPNAPIYPGTDGTSAACATNYPVYDRVQGAGRHPNALAVDEYLRPSGVATCTAGGVARDNIGGAGNNFCFFCASQTCDRTVQDTGVAWAKYPLLAPPKDVENAISTDSSYSCTISYDDGAKKDKSTPKGGCCGSAVSITTSTNNTVHTSAHLEPGPTGTLCQVPEY